MIRLVTSYRKDLLTETHLHLAQQLETEGEPLCHLVITPLYLHLAQQLETESNFKPAATLPLTLTLALALNP